MRAITSGLIAGAAGTAALNISTYLDIAVRARPASSTPARSVQRLADIAGVDLGGGAEERKEGLGALLGYATGLSVAVGYRLAVRERQPPWPVAAAGLTAMAMIGSNAPMTLLGVTDPRKWSAGAWVADTLPHLAYGAAAAWVDGLLRRLWSY